MNASKAKRRSEKYSSVLHPKWKQKTIDCIEAAIAKESTHATIYQECWGCSEKQAELLEKWLKEQGYRVYGWNGWCDGYFCFEVHWGDEKPYEGPLDYPPTNISTKIVIASILGFLFLIILTIFRKLIM